MAMPRVVVLQAAALVLAVGACGGRATAGLSDASTVQTDASDAGAGACSPPLGCMADTMSSCANGEHGVVCDPVDGSFPYALPSTPCRFLDAVPGNAGPAWFCCYCPVVIPGPDQ
jgi:hypothetical protein